MPNTSIGTRAGARLLVIVVLCLAVLYPILVTNPYYQHIMNAALLYAISVYALNIILGLTGQLNIAHAGFMGIGAYTSSILTTQSSIPFLLAMPMAVLVTVFFGFLIGYVSLRTRGVYFALTTLGFGEVLFLVFDNWVPVTGGPMGIVGIPAPTISLPGEILLIFNSKAVFYYVCLAFVLLSIYLNRQLLNSRLGHAMLAVRESEDLAESVGISIGRTKITSFVLSTVLLGVCGSLYAHYFLVVSPVVFTIGESFRVFTMLIVGGSGTILGPLVGSLLLTGLPEFLRVVEVYQWISYGLILMLCVVFMPQGIVALLKDKLG